MSTDDLPCAPLEYEDDEEAASATEPTLITSDDAHHVDHVQSLSEIDVHVEESTSDDEASDGQTSDAILIDTVEGSEEEIQKQQIANIYRLLNDQQLINNWSTTDFLDQLKMYGLEPYEEEEEEEASESS